MAAFHNYMILEEDMATLTSCVQELYSQSKVLEFKLKVFEFWLVGFRPLELEDISFKTILCPWNLEDDCSKFVSVGSLMLFELG